MSRRVVFASIAALLILSLTCTLYWPMGRDQGIFAWAGAVVLRGGVPYRDVWDVKGPLAFYTFAMAIELFGHNEWNIRALDAALLVFTLPLFVRVGRRVASALAGWLCAGFYLMWYWGQGYWGTAQPDGWIALIQVGILWLILAVEPAPLARRRFFLAGILIALAMLYKPPYGLYLGPVAFAAWHYRSRWRERILDVTMAAVGLSIPLLLTIAWFAAHGALKEFVETQLVYNLKIHSGVHRLSDPDTLHRLVRFWTVKRHALMLLLAAVGAWRVYRNRRPVAASLAAFAAADLACVLIQQKFYDYHWEPFFVLITLLQAVAVAWLAELANHAVESHRTRPWLAGRVTAATAVALAAFFAMSVPMVRETIAVARVVMGKDTWAHYYASYIKPSVLSERAVAKYIGGLSHPGDGLVVWGFDPLINYDAGRDTPTRFGYHYPLTREPLQDLQVQWREEFLRDVKQHPPLYVVVADNDPNNLTPRTSRDYLDRFPEFERWVVTGYTPVEKVNGDYEIWRRRGDAINAPLTRINPSAPMKPALVAVRSRGT